ncbi:hypothetical protein D9M71_32140 [compost metagenome]
MSYSQEFKNFVATIAGEAGGCSVTTWKVVAHCIKNRLGFAEWIDAENIGAYLIKDFDALTDQTGPVKKVINEMNKCTISKHTQDIIDAVYPIYQGIEEDFTNGVVLYFSPNAQALFHKNNPSKYKAVPDFINSKTEVVSIKGTENDDMRWYRLKGSSRFYIRFVDISANPLVGSKVNISYKKTKNVPVLNNLNTNNKGEIRSILVADGWGARFSVDSVSIKDDKDKELMLIADGKNHSTTIVVNNRKGGIKSKTDIHNQQITVSQSKQEKTSESASKEESKNNSSNNSVKSDVSFNIKIIDSENKPIPNMSYLLKYKGNEKKHSVDADGIGKNIIAESGQTLSVEISGKDARQIIKSFTATEGVSEQIVKFELYHFEILFRHKKSKKAISHLNLIQTYRGKKNNKQTNSEGKILVNAMPGFEINYKLRDGRNLLTIKVDKNKDIRIIDVDSDAVEQAVKNLKEGVKLPQHENQAPNTTSKSKQEVQTEDQTTKRDQTTKTSSDGHPKIIVNDNEEVEFIVLTYAEKTNQLFSGGSYIIEYKGNKHTHISGTHGIGKKIHKAQLGQTIKFFVHNNLVAQVDLQKDMQPIAIKVNKPDIFETRVSGVDWCKLFLQSSSLNDLAEPFKTNAKKFINGMKMADITVVINTTWRPDQRSYLMYYSTAITRGQIAVDKVPPFPGVNIDWTHNGNKEAAVRAAKLMYQKYGVGNNPVGKPGSSNHNKKMAVDMRITNYNGKVVIIDGERTEITSWAVLTQLGRKHNVIWYGVKDKPHWSHTGK